MPVNLGRDQPTPRAGRRGDPSDGARVRPGRGSASPRPTAMNDVTRILSAIEHGDPRRPSSSCRWSTTSCASWPPSEAGPEKPGQTLQATALVHEAYVRLVDVDESQTLERPGPFLRRGGRGDAAASWSSAPGEASPAGEAGHRVELAPIGSASVAVGPPR